MKLTREGLKEAGAFTGGPVKKEITWKGDTFEVYVRRLSYHTAVSDVRSIHTNQEVGAWRIAHCICDEDGSPIFEYRHVTGRNEDGSLFMVKDPDTGKMVEHGALDPELTQTLLLLISEVNKLGKHTPPEPMT